MKRLAFGALCTTIGFVGGASVFIPARGYDEAPVYHQLDLFSDAFERVRENYVTPVDDQKLVSNAIEGMVSSLDPHSAYMDPQSLKDLQNTTKGEFGGIGIEIKMEG